MQYRQAFSFALAIAMGVSFFGIPPARAELGWTEAEYAKHVGPAMRSRVTSDEKRFSAPGGGSLLVRFANGRSIEEAWTIDRDASFVPAPLLARARALVKGQPIRRIVFRRRHAAPAEIFEERHGDTLLRVDYRNRAVMRIFQCGAASPCRLFDQLLAIERATDDLLARTEAAAERQAHGH